MNLFLIILQIATIFVSRSSSCIPRRSDLALTMKEEGNSRLQSLPILRFNSQGKFKIANFADLHFGENPESDWGPIQDAFSAAVIQEVLDTESPDLVVFTGDQLTAENMPKNGTEYLHEIFKPLVDGNFKWASIYGNHDLGPEVTREAILALEQTYNLSYTVQMDSSLPGVTNYYLLVFPPDGAPSNDVPALILWFFDSRGGRNEFGGQPHHIDSRVVDWFRVKSAHLQLLYGNVPALAFFHIPPIEYGPVQDNIEGNSACIGLVDDDVSHQDRNSGIMAALEEAGNIKTIFTGHDHGNAWCCLWKGIEVCYNRHTGYGGYGGWSRGARVIILDHLHPENRTNYIRMEDGSIRDEFPRRKRNK